VKHTLSGNDLVRKICKLLAREKILMTDGNVLWKLRQLTDVNDVNNPDHIHYVELEFSNAKG